MFSWLILSGSRGLGMHWEVSGKGAWPGSGRGTEVEQKAN